MPVVTRSLREHQDVQIDPVLSDRSVNLAKLKALLRKAAARTLDDLWRVIGESLEAFKPRECADYFEAAGYDAW